MKKTKAQAVEGSVKHKARSGEHEEDIGGDVFEVELDANSELGRVSYSLRRTINLGNFESVQIGISMDLPFEMGKGKYMYDKAENIVNSKMEEEVSKWQQ
ncbi:MAG TPA: hypothetical protein ENI23_09280 [bacterium]|nr:hypothetical protein [bacterium]